MLRIAFECNDIAYKNFFVTEIIDNQEPDVERIYFHLKYTVQYVESLKTIDKIIFVLVEKFYTENQNIDEIIAMLQDLKVEINRIFNTCLENENSLKFDEIILNVKKNKANFKYSKYKLLSLFNNIRLYYEDKRIEEFRI